MDVGGSGKGVLFDQSFRIEALKGVIAQHQEALLVNSKNREHFEKILEDYRNLEEKLKTLPDKLYHEALVPVAPRALMEGRIVHTNEIMCFLGDGWFMECSAKKASEIAGRRIKKSNEMLDKLNKECLLYESWVDSIQSQIDEIEECSGIEIIEEYDEERESEWRKMHRQNVRKSYQEKARQRLLNNIKEDEESNSDNDNDSNDSEKDMDEEDEELWGRLDELEIEEEEMEYEMMQKSLEKEKLNQSKLQSKSKVSKSKVSLPEAQVTLTKSNIDKIPVTKSNKLGQKQKSVSFASETIEYPAPAPATTSTIEFNDDNNDNLNVNLNGPRQEIKPEDVFKEIVKEREQVSKPEPEPEQLKPAEVPEQSEPESSTKRVSLFKKGLRK